jgi:NitT/TauT family transport system substrate-binding protein
LLAGAPILASPSLARAADLRKVTMRLDWLFQGPNDGFVIAQAKGFYKALGLDVDIGPNKGSGSTAQLVAMRESQQFAIHGRRIRDRLLATGVLGEH